MRDGKVSLLSRVVTVLVYAFLMAPLLVIILASFSPTPIVTFPPKGFSTEWYAKIFDSSTNFVSGFVNSMEVAALATLVDIVLGVSAALAVSRYRFRGREALVTFFTSPMYVPSITFAFVLLNVTSAHRRHPRLREDPAGPRRHRAALHRAQHARGARLLQLDAGGRGGGPGARMPGRPSAM